MNTVFYVHNTIIINDQGEEEVKALQRTKTLIALSVGSILTASLAHSNDAPNVILIVADDLGFSDIESFGGEISTPNLKKIAEQGIQFSQYYTSPMSAPARSMLLTGNTNQQAGMGAMWWYESTKGKVGYELRLSDRTVTMAERFRDAGYETMMVGKWHIGKTPDSLPGGKGFNQSFAFMGGGASHYSDAMPLGEVEAYHTYYTLNDQKVDQLPEDFYSTKFYTDQIITWIKDTPKDQPVFAYIAYTAPHDPLHAPEEWIKKYDGVYDKGYQSIYEKRIENLTSKGIITVDTPLPELNLQARWDALSQEDQQREIKTMQIYAAMVDYMDDQIGKVVDTLQETGRLDNTIIIFASDNGANATPGLKFYSLGDMSVWDRLGVDNRYENLGRQGSFISVGADWSDINNAPYGTYHKTTTGQGGINTAMMISAPMFPDTKKGTWDKQMIAVYDLAPTLYDLTGIELKEYSDKLPVYGVSHKDHLLNHAETTTRAQFGTELHNQLGFIDGEWKVRKLTKTGAVAVDGDWQLFNIKHDPLETQDVGSEFPELMQDMIQKYNQFAKETMVIEAKGQRIWGSTE